MTYTTKRHQTEEHGDRFRLVLPINYILELDSDEYKEFMNNVMMWLPFKTDESANQRSKKWETYQGNTTSMKVNCLMRYRTYRRLRRTNSSVRVCRRSNRWTIWSAGSLRGLLPAIVITT